MTDSGVHIGYPCFSSMEDQNEENDEYRIWGFGKDESNGFGKFLKRELKNHWLTKVTEDNMTL